jgi:glutamyl-tRNA reductase
LCENLEKDISGFRHYFTERAGEEALKHLCRVASGLDSQIIGDDQIITQVREALELSRNQNCADSYMETVFKTAIQAAKSIKTNVILKTLGFDSVPRKTVGKIKAVYPLTGKNAVVIGNGQMGRLVSELLIRERANVTVTLREYKKGVVKVPSHAKTISYNERYRAIEKADIVVSATTSPHFTIYHDELDKLSRLPEIFADLAVPRDIEPTVQRISGITLLTIDDISGESRILPPESIKKIDGIIGEHLKRYNNWFSYKEKLAGGIV